MYFNRADILRAYYFWLACIHDGANREHCSQWQRLLRLIFLAERAGIDLDARAWTENTREIYDSLVRKF